MFFGWQYHVLFGSVASFGRRNAFPGFLGRSMGCLLTSTRITSKKYRWIGVPFARQAKHLRSHQVSLTLWIVEQTVISLTPKDWAIWYSVRYSCEYIKVISSWSVRLKLGGRPKLLSPISTTWSTSLKSTYFTPVRCLNSMSFRCWIV